MPGKARCHTPGQSLCTGRRRRGNPLSSHWGDATAGSGGDRNGQQRTGSRSAALRETAFSSAVITFRDSTKWATRRSPNGSSKPITRRHSSSASIALEATGRHVKLAGVTVADFRDGKIRSFRTYFDDGSLIEQIAGL